MHHLAALGENVRGTLVLAVSGGSDSTALLACVAEAVTNGWPVEPVAVTIDHGLRAQSAAEAEQVGQMCERFGIRHITRKWQGAKPSTSVQDIARAKRRAMLCETAGDIGASIILTGHTLDDQIETVAMRSKRGDGPGLAGIAPVSLAFNDAGNGQGIWIVRPFLEERRATLRSFLLGRSIGWIDDPSNENPAFERVIIRRELEAAGRERFTALRYVQQEAARRRVAISREAARLLSFYASEPSTGLIRLDPGIFQSANLEAIRLVIQVLAAFAGGSAQTADGRSATFVLESALISGFGNGRKPARRAFAGAVVDVRKDGVWFMRESRRSTSGSLSFDGRYRVLGSGREPRTAWAPPANFPIAASLIQHALSTEPVFQTEDGTSMTAMSAAQSGRPLRRLFNPWPDLVPGFDLAFAEKLSILAGEGEFPPCPVHLDGKN